MKIQVNGDPVAVADGGTVQDLLDQLGMVSRAIAVEVNEHVLPREQHGSHVLQENDTLEIVTLVGGG